MSEWNGGRTLKGRLEGGRKGIRWKERRKTVMGEEEGPRWEKGGREEGTETLR